VSGKGTVRALGRTPFALVRDRRAAVTDLALFGLLALPVVSGMRVDDVPGRWAQVGGLVLLAVAVGVGRRRPTLSVFIVISLTMVHGNFVFGMPVLSFLAGRRTPLARPMLWVFASVFVLGALVNMIRGTDVTTWFPFTVYLVLLGVVPWLIGRYWRLYRELVLAGWQRAEQLEREQRIIADRERLRERSRIARDMHDSLGHDLSLIALRAGALELDPDLDDRRRAAAGELRSSATAATERLSEILGVLRDDSDPAPMEPARESIAELVARTRASGLTVSLRHEGERVPLTPMVDRAGYRVVQEALTNATKHAPGAAVVVQLAQAADETVVTVANEPPPGPTAPARAQGRRGLTGLRERVRLVGGTLGAGETPQGGFEVVARLPHAATAGVRDDSADDAGTSESAHQLARAQARVRRGLIAMIVAPAALLAVLASVMIGYYVYVTFNSVLPPEDFHRLTIGQEFADVQPVLPRMELLSGPSENDPPPPARASCRYYRPDANLLGLARVHRLCFVDGRLAAKDVIPVGTAAPAPSPAR
jgi:signal transduction histidine kinase